jgi:MFS family permease
VNLSFGVFLAPLSAELGASRAAISLGAALNLLLYGLSQPFFGRMIDAYGPRRVMAIGVALMAIGNLLMSRVDGLWQLYLFYGFLAGAGFTASAILPVSILVLRWVEHRRGLILGTIATGASLGQALFYQVAATLITHLGWRAAYLVFGALLVALVPFCLLLIRDHPGPTPVRGDGRRATAVSIGPVLRRRTFLLIGGAYLACGFTDFMITTHLAVLATDRGLPSAVGARALSVLAIANIVGLLVGGRLADAVGNRQALVVVYAVRALSLTMLVFVHDRAELYVFAALFGATFFTTAPLTSGLITEVYGLAMTGTLYGAVNAAHHLAGAFGSYVAGVVFDVHGSYLPIFTVGAATIYVTIFLTRLIDARCERMRS